MPLVTESFFHDMINVTSSDYRLTPLFLHLGFNNAEGFFTLRQSGENGLINVIPWSY